MDLQVITFNRNLLTPFAGKTKYTHNIPHHWQENLKCYKSQALKKKQYIRDRQAYNKSFFTFLNSLNHVLSRGIQLRLRLSTQEGQLTESMHQTPP